MLRIHEQALRNLNCLHFSAVTRSSIEGGRSQLELRFVIFSARSKSGVESMASRIGTDIGGTFVDLIYFDDQGGQILVGKTLSAADMALSPLFAYLLPIFRTGAQLEPFPKLDRWGRVIDEDQHAAPVLGEMMAALSGWLSA
jgi:hypothetical protein